MKELNLQSGGRPVYVEDLQILQENTAAIEKILIAQKCHDCVLGGCEMTTSGSNKIITEGYIFLDGKIRYVPQSVVLADNFYIVPDDKESEQEIRYKNGNTAKWFLARTVKIIYEEPTSGVFLRLSIDLTDMSTLRFWTYQDEMSKFQMVNLDLTNDKDLFLLNTAVFTDNNKLLLNTKKCYLPTLETIGLTEGQYIIITDNITIQGASFAPSRCWVYYIELQEEQYTYLKFVRYIDNALQAPENEVLLAIIGGNIASSKYAGLMSPEQYGVYERMKGFLSDGGAIKGDLTIGENGVTLSSNANGDVLTAKTPSSTPATVKAQRFLAGEGNTDIGALAKQAVDALPAKQDIIYGQIIMWAGALDNLPSGYLLCDGKTYAESDYPKLAQAIGHVFGKFGVESGNFCVPDLSGRFVVGCRAQDTRLGQTGGNDRIQLQPENLPTTTAFLADGWTPGGDFTPAGSQIVTGIAHTDTFIGRGESFDNRPPFFTLAYLIRAY